jgi:hypothetical protein
VRQTGKPDRVQLCRYIAGELAKIMHAQPKLERLVRSLGRSGRVIVFGGFVRDAVHNFLHSDSQQFRDLDLVVDGKLESSDRRAMNHFGGYRNWFASGMKIDYWPLEKTYAFSKGFFHPSLENLPLTTVYTINACALDTSDWKLFDHFALEAIAARRISFNCKRCLGVFPEYQVFRAVDFSERLSYELDADVESFVCDVMSSTPLEAFVRAVKEHRPDVNHSRLKDMYESRRHATRTGTHGQSAF